MGCNFRLVKADRTLAVAPMSSCIHVINAFAYYRSVTHDLHTLDYRLCGCAVSCLCVSI